MDWRDYELPANERKRKQQQVPNQPKTKKPIMCSFCGQKNAAITVPSLLSSSSSSIKHNKRQKSENGRRPLCLLHYYTTRAVQSHNKNCNKIRLAGDDGNDDDALHEQLPEMIGLLEEAASRLRKEICQETRQSTTQTPQQVSHIRNNGNHSNNHRNAKHGAVTEQEEPSTTEESDDPLAMLHDSRRTKKKPTHPTKPKSTRQPKRKHHPTLSSPPKSRSSHEQYEGGFVRDVQLPQRFVKHQQQMRQNEQNQISPTHQKQQQQPNKKQKLSIEQHAVNHIQSNPYKRRKPHKTSLWNLSFLDSTKKDSSFSVDGNGSSMACSACQSSNVISHGNLTARNSSMSKGEIWGNKDRSEMTMTEKYQCRNCGNIWIEEE